MLSSQMITEYQALIEKKLGREISREEALEGGTKLLRLVSLIYKPISTTEYQQLQVRRQQTGDIKIKR